MKGFINKSSLAGVALLWSGLVLCGSSEAATRDADISFVTPAAAQGSVGLRHRKPAMVAPALAPESDPDVQWVRWSDFASSGPSETMARDADMSLAWVTPAAARKFIGSTTVAPVRAVRRAAVVTEVVVAPQPPAAGGLSGFVKRTWDWCRGRNSNTDVLESLMRESQRVDPREEARAEKAFYMSLASVQHFIDTVEDALETASSPRHERRIARDAQAILEREVPPLLAELDQHQFANPALYERMMRNLKRAKGLDGELVKMLVSESARRDAVRSWRKGSLHVGIDPDALPQAVEAARARAEVARVRSGTSSSLLARPTFGKVLAMTALVGLVIQAVPSEAMSFSQATCNGTTLVSGTWFPNYPPNTNLFCHWVASGADGNYTARAYIYPAAAGTITSRQSTVPFTVGPFSSATAVTSNSPISLPDVNIFFNSIQVSFSPYCYSDPATCGPGSGGDCPILGYQLQAGPSPSSGYVDMNPVCPAGQAGSSTAGAGGASSTAGGGQGGNTGGGSGGTAGSTGWVINSSTGMPMLVSSSADAGLGGGDGGGGTSTITNIVTYGVPTIAVVGTVIGVGANCLKAKRANQRLKSDDPDTYYFLKYADKAAYGGKRGLAAKFVRAAKDQIAEKNKSGGKQYPVGRPKTIAKSLAAAALEVAQKATGAETYIVESSWQCADPRTWICCRNTCRFKGCTSIKAFDYDVLSGHVDDVVATFEASWVAPARPSSVQIAVVDGKEAGDGGAGAGAAAAAAATGGTPKRVGSDTELVTPNKAKSDDSSPSSTPPGSRATGEVVAVPAPAAAADAV